MTPSTLKRAAAAVAAVTAVAAVGVGQLMTGGVASATPTSQTVTTSNITATKKLDPAVARPGDTVTATVQLSASGTDRYMQDFTDYPPENYVLQSVSANVWRSGPTLGGWNKGGQYDGTPTQESGTGAVKLSWRSGGNCAGAGCKLVLLDKGATLTFTYKVAADAPPGPRPTGMAFNVYSFSTEQQWKPMTGLTVSVDKLPTTTTVSAPASATTGDPVILTADVSPANATGAVQFTDGGVDIGSPAPVVNGQASLPHVFTTAGAHPVSATFAGTGQFAGSVSDSRTVTVNAPPPVVTTTSLSLPLTVTAGEPTQLVADIHPPNAAGTVQFAENGTALGGPVPVADGRAVLEHSFPAVGSRSITASFIGAPGFIDSAAPAQSIMVTQPPSGTPTTTALAAPATADTGTPVTLTATVTPQNAAGTVQFKDGGVNLGNPVPVTNGEAALQHSFTTAGDHNITAVFAGAAGFANSTAQAKTVTVTVPVTPDVQTSLALSVPAHTQTGTAADLTAAVAPANAKGTVQFTVDGNNAGTPVTVVNGTATLPRTFTAAGAYTVGAIFTGAAGFAGSTATPQQVQVSDPTPEDAVTTTTVTAPGSVKSGTKTRLTATVTGADQLPGTVQFFDGDTPIGVAVPIVDGVAELEYTFTVEGVHAVTAKYYGGQGVKPSTSTPQNVDVLPADGTGGGGTGSLGSLGF